MSILLTLNVRGRVSARDLADQLEVSIRTIYRDVEALGAAGVPVYATRGREGGFALVQGYRTTVPGLTPDEAGALLLAGLPAAATALGFGSVLAATRLKLLSALPELRERAGRVDERFHLDAPGWLRDTESPSTLPTIAEAVWAQRRVRLRYERSNRVVVDRLVEPLGVVLKAGIWYLVAAVPDDRRGPRTYRVSRVLAVDTTGEQFDRPPDFELAEFWADYQRGYAQRVFSDRAVIRLSPAGRELLFLVGLSASRAAHEAMTEPDADGWAQTTLPIESVRHAHHALLQLGADVVVVEPVELRELIQRSARELLRRYG
jgi:predicted DNA-binding transcriptional regulator YafY